MKRPAAFRRAATVVVALGLAASSTGPAAAKTAGGAASPPAGDITSIAPATAERGGLVTIAGRGFGGPNVKITVDGIAAAVVSATGSTATFAVPSLAGPGNVSVRAQNPGGQTGSIGLFVNFDGHVDIAADTVQSAGGDVGAAGGTVSANGVTLDVPPGALAETQHITLTPITLRGSPFDDSLIAGVRFEPDGLQFLKPATLTMPLPAGVAPDDVLGFAGDGDGTDVHLTPSFVSGGSITLLVSHFSIGGASSGGTGAAQIAATYTPTTIQKQAEQILGTPPRIGSADEFALKEWFTLSVLPHLKAAFGGDIRDFEQAAGEWSEWEAYVQRFGSEVTATGQTVAEALTAARDVAFDQATRDGASTADVLLSRCTGIHDLFPPLHDVVHLTADLADLDLPIDTFRFPNGHTLPPVEQLPRTCEHVEIVQVVHPSAFARARDNTVTAQLVAKFADGPDRTDVPVVVDLADRTSGVPSSIASDTVSNGQWQVEVNTNTAGTLSLELTANLLVGEQNKEDLGDVNRFSVDVRDRVELQALGANGFADAIDPIKPGETVPLRVRLAGDGITGAALTYGLSGPGSLSVTTGAADASGEARFDYTAPPDDIPGTATITATIDGEGTSDTLTITIKPDVKVTVSPKSVTVAPGKKILFTAQVQGAADQTVSWGATGGTIDASGRYTAGSTPGTFAVAAVSNADPGVSDTATVVIQATPTAVTRLDSDGAVSASCSVNDGGGARTSPFDATSWNDSASCNTTGTNSFGHQVSSTGHATAQFDEAYSQRTLVSVTASGSGSGSGTGPLVEDYGIGDGIADYEITFSVAATTKITVQATATATGSGVAVVVLNCFGTPVTLIESDSPGTDSDFHQLAGVTVTVAAGTICGISGDGRGDGDPFHGPGSGSFGFDVSFG